MQLKLCISTSFAFVLVLAYGTAAQVPTATLVRIVKAEDARAYEPGIEDLMRSPNAEIRTRATLAAGRIGDERAIAALVSLLENDPSQDVRTMAAFAIGEIESIKGADAILKVLSDTRAQSGIRARAVEAAGKIAAANAKDENAKALGAAIVEVLIFENSKRSAPYTDVVRLGLTAALRARPDGATDAVKSFLGYSDPRVVADALNTLTRLRGQTANARIREMLLNGTDVDVRVNAARALGAAEDKEAFNLLLDAATVDKDPAVRISAIRALASLKNTAAFERLIERGKALLVLHEKSKFKSPVEKSELLEIVSTLRRLVPNTEDDRAVSFLNQFRMADSFASPETEITLARIAPKMYSAMRFPDGFAYKDSRLASAYAQGLSELATDKDETIKRDAALKLTEYVAGMASQVKPADQAKMMKAMPDLTAALAAFKPDNLDEILRGQLTNADVFLRAATAGLIAERPATKENIEALNQAFNYAFLRDKHDNDATLAILDAAAKLSKKEAVTSALMALNSPDYLVRKKGFEILADKDAAKDAPGVPAMVAAAKEKHKDQVQPYSSAFGTKLGQMLSTDADYRRAVSRKNGSVKAVLTTEKGTFTIVFSPEEAPLTVDNWVKLARAGYFDGLEVHRVVPNFVMQDGDPRGDGNGGPGWSIRCEVNMLPYDRGAVGMALSGKDTGGSQWFVTHSPQPHLDGGYTVFGKVNETDMKVVDSIVRGDKIISVKIVEGGSPQRPPTKN